MTFRTDSVFQAFCTNHPCALHDTANGSGSRALLVSISSRSARVRLEELAPPPASGQRVRLAPNFRSDFHWEDIEARVDEVRGRVVRLRFASPLPLSGARLCQLTRR
ncbi:MAG: hypothetical protein AB7D51_14050 [Desulfovibrionaceae bacterium]|jgi:hypothetical protein